MHGGKGFAAFLFDMDGTLLSSLGATERKWSAWAIRHGLDPVAVLPLIHGVRAENTVARLALPGVDSKLEAEAIILAELQDLNGVEALPGAVRFVATLPLEQWAIVTSAPRELAKRRLAASRIPLPTVLIAAEDVSQGKPSPEGFLLAADRLCCPASQCVVFEDSEAGVAAAEAAGMNVIIVTGCQPHGIDINHPSTVNYSNITVAFLIEF